MSNATKTPGQEFAQEFSHFLNTLGNKRLEDAADAMMNEHRTLQQAGMRFFMMYAERMAKQNHDLRNEASVKLAKAIMELPPKVRCLPFV
jgi:aspartate/glutamate racemase